MSAKMKFNRRSYNAVDFSCHQDGEIFRQSIEKQSSDVTSSIENSSSASSAPKTIEKNGIIVCQKGNKPLIIPFQNYKKEEEDEKEEEEEKEDRLRNMRQKPERMSISRTGRWKSQKDQRASILRIDSESVFNRSTSTSSSPHPSSSSSFSPSSSSSAVNGRSGGGGEKIACSSPSHLEIAGGKLEAVVSKEKGGGGGISGLKESNIIKTPVAAAAADDADDDDLRSSSTSTSL